MKNGKIALGLLAGIAAGAVLGILFAPDKGSHTRRKISRKGEEFSDDVTGKYNDLKNTITEKYENILHQAGDMVNNGKARYNAAKNEMKNMQS